MASAVFEQMRARGAPLNDIREALEKATPIEVWAALPRPPPMVPWQTKERRALFEKLLQEDRKENFTERIRYYEEVKVLKPSIGWIETCFNGGHCAYAIVDDERHPPFVFSIGLHYWYPEIPEILIVLADKPRDYSTMVEAATLLNAAAAKLKANPTSIVAGTTAFSVWGPRFDGPEMKFENVTSEDRASFLGSAVWFHTNFADTRDFPALKVVLRTKTGTEELINTLTTSIFEGSENVTAVPHGELTSCPVPKPGKPHLASFFKSAYKPSTPLAQFPNESSTSFSLTKAQLIEEAAAVVSPTILKKILEASKRVKIGVEHLFNYAIFNERNDNLKALIEMGLNFHGNGKERSPLMNAVQCGFEEAVKILVDSGADLKKKDYEGWTALSISVEALVYDDHEKAKRITQYLWDHGARDM